MKYIGLFSIFFFTVGYGQNFSIIPDCVDTLSNGEFHFSISGEAVFSDSLSVYVELRSADSLETILFSGTKDFSNASNTTLTNFTYDVNLGTFSIDLVDLPTNQLFILIRSSVFGEKREEILIPAFLSF